MTPSMLRTRVLTACALAIVLLTGLFLLPARWSVGAFALVFLRGAWEWAAFGGLAGAGARIAYLCGAAILMLAAWTWSASPPNMLLLCAAACLWWAIAFLWLCICPERQRPVVTLLCGAVVLVPAFVAIGRLLVADRGFASGPQAVLGLVLLVVAADIGAFFAGRRFGRLKLAPRVSPAKTWEGAAGGLLLVVMLALAGAGSYGLPVLPVLGFGCAIGMISIVGDLTESMFKRAAGLKDSGMLLPGHGGMLDRIDSVTAAAPLYALGLFGSGVLA
jgi:phosphatidate cytidylyltransferase